MGRLIRFGLRLRYRGENRKYARVNHFAWVLSPTELSEALLKGVQRTPLSRYDGFNYVYVKMNATQGAYKYTSVYVHDVLEQRTGYGFRTIANILLTYLTGWGWVAPKENTAICSGYGAEGIVGLRRDVLFDMALFKVDPAAILKYVDDTKHTDRVSGMVGRWLDAE